jgi:2-iminobutanoate/2-iminopropanoate deaminase
MKQVIPTSDVLQYEPFGFTNCVRCQDVLYLSGIAALDV